MEQQSSAPVIITQSRHQCRHIHARGNQCGSPALRGEQFCYFHHTTRRPRQAGKFKYINAQEPFELPVVEDRASALSVAAQLLSRIASNDLDVSRAGRLLYNLQILNALMPKEPRAPAETSPAPAPSLVDAAVYDETHGLIAALPEPAAQAATEEPPPSNPPHPDPS
jgi:hypothetical protein